MKTSFVAPSAGTGTAATAALDRRPVPIQPPPEKAPKALRDEFQRLQQRANELQRLRSDLSEQISEFRQTVDSADIESIDIRVTDDGVIQRDSSFMEGSTEIRDAAIAILRNELKLRTDLNAYLRQRSESLRKASGEAKVRLDQTANEIRAGLIKFGYLDPEQHKLSLSRVIPGMIFQHPQYVAAHREWKGLSEYARQALVAENTREIETIKRMLQSEARRLAGV